MEVSGQLQTLAASFLGKFHLVPSGLEAGWATELVWMLWNREKISSLCQDQTLAIQSICYND
jgi:hypothetical protein